MKTLDALDLLNEILPEDECWPVKELCDLILWVYDKGWEDALEHYHDSKEGYVC